MDELQGALSAKDFDADLCHDLEAQLKLKEADSIELRAQSMILSMSYDEPSKFVILRLGTLASSLTREPSRLETILGNLEGRVLERMNKTLTRPISVDEVRNAVFNMAPDSSHRCDGFTTGFFRNIGQLWAVILHGSSERS
ncbi:hypothetical protein Dimus_030543 [Dionaea muscipula]